MNVIKFICNLALLSLSYLNLCRANKKNISKASYFILKNTKNFIDPRSIKFANITKDNLSSSLNFVRSVSLKLSFKAILSLKNIFIINSLHDVILFKNNFFNKSKKDTHKQYFHTIFLILKYSKIKKFTMIDDYRLMNLFLPALEKLKIVSNGYMHGRVSNNLKFQENLKKYKFDKYYVWNEYFKKKILIINKRYKNNEVILKNPLKNYKTKSDLKKKGIIIIEEDKVNLSFYKEVVNELKKQDKFIIYFKLRPNNKINIKLITFLKKNGINYYHKENVYKLFSKLNIKILLALNSSLLVESSYYKIVPLMVSSNKLSLKELITDKIVFHSKIKNLSKFLDNVGNLDKLLNMRKKKIWGKF